MSGIDAAVAGTSKEARNPLRSKEAGVGVHQKLVTDIAQPQASLGQLESEMSAWKPEEHCSWNCSTGTRNRNPEVSGGHGNRNPDPEASLRAAFSFHTCRSNMDRSQS